MPEIAVAPAAPGEIGRDLPTADLAAYLQQIARWCTLRRAELHQIDELLPAEAGIADLTLSLALWQAVSSRAEEIRQIWDSGRVGEVERRKIGTLIWARVESTGSVSVPEACRLSDALAGQLRQQLGLSQSQAVLTEQLAQVRHAVERLRQIPGMGQNPKWLELDRRHRELLDSAQRGGDLGGFLPALSAAVARLERDAIVRQATTRKLAELKAEITRERDRLSIRCGQMAEVAARCRQEIAAAPRFAVPELARLGPVPPEAEELIKYRDKLASVDRALTAVETAYRTPLTERDQLRSWLGALAAKALAINRSSRPEVAFLGEYAEKLLTVIPTDLPRCRAIVAAYQILIGTQVSAMEGKL